MFLFTQLLEDKSIKHIKFYDRKLNGYQIYLSTGFWKNKTPYATCITSTQDLLEQWDNCGI
jgi:hypothetical protein